MSNLLQNWNKILKTYSYKPKPEEIKKMSKKGWCNFKVPNKIVIEHEQHVKTEIRRYTTLEENEGSLWFESLVSILKSFAKLFFFKREIFKNIFQF